MRPLTSNDPTHLGAAATPGVGGTGAEARLPHTYPRRVLLAVTGLSPQVVTETLYGLTQITRPAFVPTEIQILSTSAGASHARLMLLDSDGGRFRAFCSEYGIDPDTIRFADASIRVLTDADDRPLADIDSAAANTAVADAITEAVRHLTADPDCAVHASIAGGRKTMGFYLGYALSLYGRPQDRLSHVLVSAPFEADHQFYYPPATPRVLIDRNNHPVSTADARVMLAEIPFVRLRHGLDPRLVDGQASYSAAVASAQVSVGPPDLALDLPGRCIRAAGQLVRLAPTRLALLAVFARRACAGAEPIAAPSKGVADRDWANRFMAEYRVIRGDMADTEQTERALRDGMCGDYFSSTLSYLRNDLKKVLGVAATPYLIEDGGRRPRRYRLALSPQAVRFTTLTAASDAGR